jgi:hypothetical protein
MSGQRSDWRKAHGKAASGGKLVVLENARDRALRPASPVAPVQADRAPDGRFTKGNRISRQAKVRAGTRGLLATLDAKAAPEWQSARRWGQRAAAHRIREVAQAHGGELSSGVCVLIADACDLRADARYLAARARAEGSADLARAAATLLASARQAERDAWELASREALVRRGTAGRSGAVPAVDRALSDLRAKRSATHSNGDDVSDLDVDGESSDEADAPESQPGADEP